MTDPVAGWVRDPALSQVWTTVRDRLERNGIEPRGTVTVRGLDRAGRHAVSGLVGRPVVRDSARIDLGDLDRLVRERAGGSGLVALLESMGEPLRNRVAERSAGAAAREQPYAAARAWVAEHAGTGASPWVEPWLAAVRSSGVLSRIGDPDVASRRVVQALEVAAALTAGVDVVPVARNVLAATVTGNSHSLDDGSVLAHLVQRALAGVDEEGAPVTPAARRRLWDRWGVLPDNVSSTCLVLGVRPLGSSPAEQRLRMAAEAGDPLHVTAWDLLRADLTIGPATRVLVCENPRVLESLATDRGGSVTVVCTSGMPGVVATDLLGRLRHSGADLRYHGDFDWPGIAIANRLTAQLGCRPWLMSASDYSVAVRPDGLTLEGSEVRALWDDDLAPAMREHGVAVHEEAVLDRILGAW